MMRASFILMTALGGVLAQEPAPFQPPQSYDVQRYETDWNKNPFTLKTAPIATGADSFAKDLAVATYFGDIADPTIVIVNTKTHERTSLQKGRTAGNGWKLGVVRFGTARKDIAVELIQAHERALLKFDDPYVRALAASSTPATGQATRQPGAPATEARKLSIPLPGSKTTPSPPAGLNKTAPPPTTGASGAAAAVILPPLPAVTADGIPRQRLLAVPLPSTTSRQGSNSNEPSS